MRIDKFLSETGVLSRKESGKASASGIRIASAPAFSATSLNRLELELFVEPMTMIRGHFSASFLTAACRAVVA